MADIVGEIRKDGRLYRLAYGRFKEEDRPQVVVNLCDAIWRAAVRVILLTFVGFAMTVTSVFVIFLVGATLYGLVVYLIPGIISSISRTLSDPGTWALFSGNGPSSFGTFCIVVGAVLILVLVLAGLGRWKKSETRSLVHAYLRAEKGSVLSEF